MKALPGFLYRFKIVFVIIICLSPALALRSQVVDSLEQIVAEQPDDQSKVDNLIQISRNYFFIAQYDSSLARCETALKLAERLNYLPGQGDAYYIKSNIYRSISDYKTSLALAEKYLEIFSGLMDTMRLAKGYYHLGLLYKDMEDYELTIFYCQKSLSYAIAYHSIPIEMGIYNCIGSVFNSYSKYDSASYYYLKALDLIEKNGLDLHLPTLMNNLGDVYLADHQYENARGYFTKSLELSIEANSKPMQALSSNNLGRVEAAESNFDKAIALYNRSYDIYQELGHKQGIASINNNIGDTYFKQGKYSLALSYFTKALDLYKEIGYFTGIVNSSLNIASAYSELGRRQEAKIMQDSCIVWAKSSGNAKLLLSSYGNIVDNLEDAGDYKTSNHYMSLYIGLRDSLYNIDKTKAINTLLLKYEKGKDQARILELEKENLKKTYQRNAFIFTILGMLALALFVFIYLRQKSKHARIIAEQKIRQLEEEKKLMAAKLLVEGQEEERKRIATELHDGLGVLLSATRMQFSTIMDKSPENREMIERASKMLEQASGDVRKISHNMMPGLLTKLGFYEAVEDLLEKIDDSGELHASCTITGEQERLPENREIMLYRIVQEMVNNSLKHARAKNIKLNILVQPGFIDLYFSDDGIGFEYDTKIESESFGLKSIQSRVNFLNGSIKIETSPGEGVRYKVHVPV
jgi:two-component system NarL family sensor kinase